MPNGLPVIFFIIFVVDKQDYNRCYINEENSIYCSDISFMFSA